MTDHSSRPLLSSDNTIPDEEAEGEVFVLQVLLWRRLFLLVWSNI